MPCIFSRTAPARERGTTRTGGARPSRPAWPPSPAIRHPAAHREQAERALDALERWRRTGSPRPISADAVALALAVRTAHALARRDAELTAAATTAVSLMADRTPEVVPELHVALACWALDDVVTDRDQAPWPALRARLEAGNTYGLDQALRSYGVAIAARQFGAARLVQNLITQIPTSPGPTDAAVDAPRQRHSARTAGGKSHSDYAPATPAEC
jgi:hypothetical protein